MMMSPHDTGKFVRHANNCKPHQGCLAEIEATLLVFVQKLLQRFGLFLQIFCAVVQESNGKVNMPEHALYRQCEPVGIKSSAENTVPFKKVIPTCHKCFPVEITYRKRQLLYIRPGSDIIKPMK